jgi:hypothetical protein
MVLKTTRDFMDSPLACFQPHHAGPRIDGFARACGQTRPRARQAVELKQDAADRVQWPRQLEKGPESGTTSETVCLLQKANAAVANSAFRKNYTRVFTKDIFPG